MNRRFAPAVSIIATLLAATSLGCSEDATTLDGGAVDARGAYDSGAVPDTGADAPDASTRDAASGPDAGTSGDGGPDAGPVPDAGTSIDGGPDAGADADAGPDRDAALRDTGDVGASACGPETTVGAAADVVALAPDPYGRNANFSARFITGDLRASAAFQLTAADFPTPSDCAAGCEPMVWLGQFGAVDGVTQAGNGTYQVAANAAFRLRFGVAFLPPLGDVANVTIDSACRRPCESDELRCAEDLTCYTDGRSYCSRCEHRTPQVCACAAPEGRSLPDGEQCSFVLGDIGFVGTCQLGECRSRQ